MAPHTPVQNNLLYLLPLIMAKGYGPLNPETAKRFRKIIPYEKTMPAQHL